MTVLVFHFLDIYLSAFLFNIFVNAFVHACAEQLKIKTWFRDPSGSLSKEAVCKFVQASAQEPNTIRIFTFPNV